MKRLITPPKQSSKRYEIDKADILWHCRHLLVFYGPVVIGVLAELKSQLSSGGEVDYRLLIVTGVSLAIGVMIDLTAKYLTNNQ